MPEVVLVYDDINLPFGKIRLSPKGGPGMMLGVFLQCRSVDKC